MRRVHPLCLLLGAVNLWLPGASFAAEGEVVMPLAPIQLRAINGKRQEIDLPTMLKLVRENSLIGAQARERANEQRANLASARAELLPNLKFDTGIGRTLGNISDIAQIPNARVTLFLAQFRPDGDAVSDGQRDSPDDRGNQSISQWVNWSMS